MKTSLKVFLLVVTIIIFITTTALAISSYQINWWTVDGGGGTSQGGDYMVSGTIGQYDTSPMMSGGDYTVVGGFRGGALTTPSSYVGYLPVVIR